MGKLFHVTGRIYWKTIATGLYAPWRGISDLMAMRARRAMERPKITEICF
jgi:hypothetical protein